MDDTKETTGPYYYSLAPILLTETDKAYSAVKELDVVLGKKDCTNIALTGTYGSGKSSILKTLISKTNDKKFLNVSLATLDKNRQDIEYSIVQQLIYKADEHQIHQSRFNKIKHLDKESLSYYSWTIFGFIIALLIIFKPLGAHLDIIESLRGNASANKINALLEVLSVVYILWFLFRVIVKMTIHLRNAKLSKLNIKEGAVDFSYSTSIFNKHLDEIVYFFKSTDYDVVIFEDLDRFENPQRLFLKLREINILVNDSEYFKIRSKAIKFIYAIKDDTFSGEERTKYFDYIVSTIPAVNANNAADFLIEKYSKKPKFKITTEQWTELGFFIEGMREIRNVINEYYQYKGLLGDNLEDHKLLSITIYKNKYPQDYAKLHYKKGVLYRAIEAKNDFIDIANRKAYAELSNLEASKQEHEQDLHNIRRNYIDYLKQNHDFRGVKIGGTMYSNDEIIKNDSVFNLLVENKVGTYYTVDEENETVSKQYDIVFKDIEDDLDDDQGYKQRAIKNVNAILELSAKISSTTRKIETVRHSSLSTVLQKIQDGNEILTVIQLLYRKELSVENDTNDVHLGKMSRMIMTLLRNGYIDELYPQYISFFHPGMLFEEDNEFLWAVINSTPKAPDFALKNVKKLLEIISNDYFDKPAILNYNLLDGLVDSGTESNEKLETLIGFIIKEELFDFIIQYEKAGRQAERFFEILLQQWDKYVSEACYPINEDKKDDLIVIFFKYCVHPEDIRAQPAQLNDSYRIIADDLTVYDVARVVKIAITLNIKFNRIFFDSSPTAYDSTTSARLYRSVVEKLLFEINDHNLRTIFGENYASAAYTTIMNFDNENVIKYIMENLENSAQLFPDTSDNESKEAIIELLNNSRLTDEWKKEYISKQTCILDKLEGVDVKYEHILFETQHIAPTWDNIIDSYIHSEKVLTAWLKGYIEANYKTLQTEKVVNRKEGNPTGQLFFILFGNNSLPIEIYTALVPQFNIHFAETDLSLLEDDRMNILLDSNKIKYNSKNITVLQENFSTEIFGRFLVIKFDGFLADEDNTIEVDNELGVYILRSVLPLDKKIKFLNRLDVEITKDAYSTAFANEICHYYLQAGIDQATNLELILLALKESGSWERKINLINAVNESLGYDKERVTEMVESLGGEYLKLNSFYGSAKFDINNQNETLLRFLEKFKHYVKNVNPTDKGKFKVSFYSK